MSTLYANCRRGGERGDDDVAGDTNLWKREISAPKRRSVSLHHTKTDRFVGNGKAHISASTDRFRPETFPYSIATLHCFYSLVSQLLFWHTSHIPKSAYCKTVASSVVALFGDVDDNTKVVSLNPLLTDSEHQLCYLYSTECLCFCLPEGMFI